MTSDKFKEVMMVMRSIYRDPKFMPDEFAFKVFYKLVEDIPDDVFEQAANEYMQSQKFPPTPADIRSYAAKIVKPASDEISELEAWNMAYRAACSISHDPDDARRKFERLPQTVQDALGRPMALYEIGFNMKEDEATTVGKSQFLRSYRSAVERRNAMAQLSPSMQDRHERLQTKADMDRIGTSGYLGISDGRD